METVVLDKPITNDHTAKGRFAPGNRAASGHTNPHARKVQALRNALFSAVSQQDVREVVVKLVELAKSGSVPAIRELLDRLFGKPQITVDMTQHGTVLELVEQIIQVNHATSPTKDHPAAPDPSRLLPQ